MAGLDENQECSTWPSFPRLPDTLKGVPHQSDHIPFHQSLSRDWLLPLKWLSIRRSNLQRVSFLSVSSAQLASQEYPPYCPSPPNPSEVFSHLAKYSSLLLSLLFLDYSNNILLQKCHIFSLHWFLPSVPNSPSFLLIWSLLILQSPNRSPSLRRKSILISP